MVSVKDDKNTSDFGIITLAIGGYYRDLALVLLESLRRHMPDTKIAVVTDGDFDRLDRYFDSVIPVKKEYGVPLRQKLFLNEYSPFKKTMFIDADSIILKNFQDFVDKLISEKYMFTSSLGRWVVTQDYKMWWIHDPKLLRQKTGFDYLHAFHGGLYFWDYDISHEWFLIARGFYDTFDKTFGLRESQGHGFDEEIAFGCAASFLRERDGFDHYLKSDQNIMDTSFQSRVRKRLFGPIEVRSRKFPYRRQDPCMFHFFSSHTKKSIYKFIKKKALRNLKEKS